MDHYHQLFKAVLPLFVVLMAGVAYTFVIGASKGYQAGNKILQETILADDYLMLYHEFVNSGPGGMLLVDLRPEVLYRMGYLKDAVNIPIDRLFDRRSLRQLRRQGSEGILLYSDSEQTSVMAYMMLASMGVENARVLAGSYDLFMDKVLLEGDNAYLFYHEEKSGWNYRALIPGQADGKGVPGGQVAPPVAVPDGGC